MGKPITVQEVEKALKSATGIKDSVEKITVAVDTLLNSQGLTSTKSQLGKAVGRVKGIFDSAAAILKPLEGLFKGVAELGVGLDIYSNLGKSSYSNPFWLTGYKQTHDRINLMRKRLRRFAKNGLYLPSDVDYSHLLAAGVTTPGAHKKILYNAAKIFSQLEDNEQYCKKRIKTLKNYNQGLWNTYRVSKKKESYADELKKHIDELRAILIIMAAFERKIDTISLSGVQYIATFEDAKTDWGALAHDALKARKKASQEIVRFTTRLRLNAELRKSMIGLIVRRSSLNSALRAPRVAPGEIRGPLGR